MKKRKCLNEYEFRYVHYSITGNRNILWDLPELNFVSLDASELQGGQAKVVPKKSEIKISK